MSEGSDLDVNIGGINGIGISEWEARGHAEYLSSFIPNGKVEWLYNRSHGIVSDLAEVVGLNYLGYSPRTARELRGIWARFHETNRMDESAKYLQFCHSQGAIHVKNALAGAPSDVRKRVIVVAIAPAAVVPRDLCFRSFNYASVKDLVPLGEVSFASAFNTNDYVNSKMLEMALKNHSELVLLQSQQEATKIDHDFQSPTFREKIAFHIAEFLEKDGRYAGS